MGSVGYWSTFWCHGGDTSRYPMGWEHSRDGVQGMDPSPPALSLASSCRSWSCLEAKPIPSAFVTVLVASLLRTLPDLPRDICFWLPLLLQHLPRVKASHCFLFPIHPTGAPGHSVWELCLIFSYRCSFCWGGVSGGLFPVTLETPCLGFDSFRRRKPRRQQHASNWGC